MIRREHAFDDLYAHLLTSLTDDFPETDPHFTPQHLETILGHPNHVENRIEPISADQFSGLWSQMPW